MSDENDVYETIFVRWITRNGKKIYASQFGLEAFPIRVRRTRKKLR